MSRLERVAWLILAALVVLSLCWPAPFAGLARLVRDPFAYAPY